MTWRPENLTAEQREERRLEAGRLLRTADLSQAEIARIVGVSRMAVTKMKQRRHGLAGLKNLPPTWATDCGDWNGVRSSQPSMPRSVTKNYSLH
jgi:hypothetical protein